MNKNKINTKKISFFLLIILLCSNISNVSFAQSFGGDGKDKNSLVETTTSSKGGVISNEETNSTSAPNNEIPSTDETTSQSIEEETVSKETINSNENTTSTSISDEEKTSDNEAVFSNEENGVANETWENNYAVDDEFVEGTVDFTNQYHQSYLTHGDPQHGTPFTISGGTITLGSKDLQTLALTSQYRIDFQRDFELKGLLTMKLGDTGGKPNEAVHSGFAISFHNWDNKYTVRNSGSAIGVYRDINVDSNIGIPNGEVTNTKEQGLGMAVVAEIDPLISWGTVDKNIEYPHIQINETDRDGEIVSFGTPNRMDGFALSGMQSSVSIKWNSQINELTIEHRGGRVQTAKKIITSERANMLKKYGALITFSGATGNLCDGSFPIKFEAQKIQYTDMQPNIETSFSKIKNNEEIELTDSDVLGEEEEVIVRHKISNKLSSTSSKHTKIQLSKNAFKENFGLGRLQIADSTESLWYKPFIIKNSIKTYVGNNGTNDNAINTTEFLSGAMLPITLEANKQVRTIEYKVKLPKVLGENKIPLNVEIKVGDIGITNIVQNKNLYVKGSNPVFVPDSNLKNALIENVSNKIVVDIRPTDLNEKVYEKELSVLDILKLREKSISDLRGIESCRNLNTVDLANNNIVDVLPLADNPKLNKVNISGNIRPINIEKLKQIKNLIINNAEIDTEYLNLISQLTNLKILEAKNNKINDVSLVKNLRNLSSLTLDKNNISDVRALKSIQSQLTTCSILNQNISVEENYIENESFSIENMIYDFDNINDDIVEDSAYVYSTSNKKLVWESIPSGTKQIQYKWNSVPRIQYSGTVVIKLKVVVDPSYLVNIPSQLELGKVLDENSSKYDPTIDPTSPEYDPNLSSSHENPVVKDMVGAKDLITLRNEQGFEGKINVYADSFCIMENTMNPDDTTVTDVYKSFNDKLIEGEASEKKEYLIQLTNENPKGVVRLKTNSKNFKTYGASYKGNLKIILEYVP